MINDTCYRIFQFGLICAVALAGGTGLTQSFAPVDENVTFDQVQTLPHREPDATVAYGDNPLQYGLLWVPSTNANAPLVILIHGGCWLNSFDVNHSRPLATALNQEGFAVWSLEYRRTGDPGGGWPGTLEDIQLALSQLERLSSYAIDLSRIAIAGHSAGGHLALMAGADLTPVQAVIGLAAIVDIETYSRGTNSCQTAGPDFIGVSLEDGPELYALANPVKQALNPASLLLHGSNDEIVPLDHFPQDLLPLSVVAGAGHFDWIHPGTPAYHLFLGMLKSRLAQ
ncbi:MAG: alpha/beta fold hydrolase [Pseudomonadota bacterium]|nr:alpha/beta fold hydrolase [Pseudomonadota bacterium]